ncbi:MAG TPA: HAD family hydrolase [Ktedonobacterales bacterium]|nr:HAD family hydrolase [Ktedonobacterales bacterium]
MYPGSPRYDAVIFDLFGTLIPPFAEDDHEDVLTRMVECLGVADTPFRQLWNYDTWPLRATGQLPTTEANIRYVCAALGVEPDADAIARAVAARVEFTRRALVPRPDALSTLAALREQGYILGLISDCTSEVPLLWPDSPFADMFDATIFSCAVGLKKPHPAIYQSACEQLRVVPERCLYVGDGSSNELSGALGCGMHPVLIAYPDEADSVRNDGEIWHGARIASLADVLALVDQPVGASGAM